MARVPRAGVLRAGAARLLRRARARRGRATAAPRPTRGARHGGRDAARSRASRRPRRQADGAHCPMRGPDGAPARCTAAAPPSPAACQMTGVCNQPAAALAAVLMQAAVPPAAFTLVPRDRARLARVRRRRSPATRSPSRPIRLRLASSLAASRSSWLKADGCAAMRPWRVSFRRGVPCSAFVVRWRLGRRAGRGRSGRGPGIDQSRQRERPGQRRPGRGGARRHGHGPAGRDRRRRRRS